jgi:hypothetical protein
MARKTKPAQPSNAVQGDIAQPDEICTQLEENYLGTLALDVRTLRTDWPEKEKRNRALDDKQINDLKEAFKRGLRRYGPNDHLKVSTTQKNFELCVAKLCQTELDALVDPTEESRQAVVDAKIRESQRRVTNIFPLYFPFLLHSKSNLS